VQVGRVRIVQDIRGVLLADDLDGRAVQYLDADRAGAVPGQVVERAEPGTLLLIHSAT
jgi:hypothetical protein